MSLASAITTAQTIFSNTGKQTATVAQNIANSGNADYSRRLAMMGVNAEGQYYVTIQRAQNDALFKQSISNTSDASGQSRLLQGLESMKSAYGGNNYPASPSNFLTSFRSSLQTYAASPGNITIASTAVAEAKDLANSLNAASASVQELRSDADSEIRDQVEELNGYLTSFEKINNAVIGAIATGKDASDMLDQRDSLLKSISDIIGISTIQRQNSDTVIYSSDGTVLFESTARTVSFTPTATYSASVKAGQPILVDNTPLKAGTGGNTTAQGTLASLLQLRDEIAPKMQEQLDEVARGLVTLFKEKSTGTTALPDKTGLFTWAGGTIPASGTITDGIAATIKIDPRVDQTPTLLRDGGINGAGYVSNTQGQAGYTKLIDSFVVAMNTEIDFDIDADLGGKATIMSYASSSIGWLEQLRKSATTANDNKTAMQAQTLQALSNDTGVSLDEELSLMLDLEQSYKASAKLLSTVDGMLTTLLDSVR